MIGRDSDQSRHGDGEHDRGGEPRAGWSLQQRDAGGGQHDQREQRSGGRRQRLEEGPGLAGDDPICPEHGEGRGRADGEQRGDDDAEFVEAEARDGRGPGGRCGHENLRVGGRPDTPERKGGRSSTARVAPPRRAGLAQGARSFCGQGRREAAHAPAMTHFKKPFDFRKSSATALAGSPWTWTRALSCCSVVRSRASKIGFRISAILGLACSAVSRMIGVGR